jgi:hypothetical protein
MTLAFWFGISKFRQLSGLDKWRLTKSIGYSILCSTLAIFILSLIVILF